MQLTRKQKRTIEKMSKDNSIEEICSVLKLPQFLVIEYQKRSNLFEKNKNSQPTEFDFKKWVKENYLSLIFFVFIIFTVYANSLGNQFLSDDIGIIQQNKDLGSAKFIFDRPLIFLRPLLYSVIFKIFGLQPAFFRLMNILFHVGTTLLLFLILSRLFSKKVALFSTALFATHPINIESVTWISGGYYAQYGFFMLFSLILYVFGQKKPKLYHLSIILYVLSLFSAERAVIFPVVIFTWELCCGNFKKNWKKLLPFLFLSLFWMTSFVVKETQNRIVTLQTAYYQKRSLANPLTQIPTAISSYLELIFWPMNLTLYHSELNFSKLNFLIRFLTALLFVSSLIYSYIKNKKIFFWLFFFVIWLSPSLTPLNISWVFAERYVYLGSTGVFLVFAYGLEKTQKYFKREGVYLLVSVLILIPLCVRTIIRNVDWTDQDHLWLAAEKTSPSSHQNHNNLGDLWARRGNFEKAVEEFQKAIELLPNYADAYHNMATSYHQLGKDDLALASYQKAIYFNPNLWQSYQNIGAILFTKGNIENAEKFYAKAVEINPQSSMLHTALGIINLKKGNLEEANKEFGIAVSLDPQNQEAQAGFLQTKTN